MHDLLSTVSHICIVIILIMGSMHRLYLIPVYKLLMIQMAYAVVTEVAGSVYLHYSNNNSFIFNIFIFVDLWLMGWVAMKLSEGKWYRRIVLAGLCTCTLITMICILQMGIDTFANWGFISGSILFIAAFLYIFIQLLLNNSTSLLLKQPVFWICTGTLLYFGCTVPLFGFLNYLIKYYPAIASKSLYVNLTLNIVRIVCTGIAFGLEIQYSRQAKTIKV